MPPSISLLIPPNVARYIHPLMHKFQDLCDLASRWAAARGMGLLAELGMMEDPYVFPFIITSSKLRLDTF